MDRVLEQNREIKKGYLNLHLLHDELFSIEKKMYKMMMSMDWPLVILGSTIITNRQVSITMASTIKELRAWLHRSHPELNRLIESTIDQTPDLRLFRSPEAKASLKPWTIDMVWNGLIDEMDNLSNSPDQSHRELYDLLLRSAIHEEQKTIQEIVDNHDKTLYVFCSTYPILSYNLLKRSSLRLCRYGRSSQSPESSS